MRVELYLTLCDLEEIRYMICHGPILNVLLFSTSPFYYFGHGPGTWVAGYTAIVSTLRTGFVKLHRVYNTNEHGSYFVAYTVFPDELKFEEMKAEHYFIVGHL